MIKYISTFRLVLRCLLVARKENSTGFSTGLTGRSKNLDPTGYPTDRSTRPTGRPDRCRSTRPVSISETNNAVFFLTFPGQYGIIAKLLNCCSGLFEGFLLRVMFVYKFNFKLPFTYLILS